MNVWISMNNRNLAIFILWLFNVSACLGIYLGFKDWFIEKTTINLMLQLLLLVIIFPIRQKKEFLLFFAFFFIGFFVEVLGVKTGFPFGEYAYGENLGIKIIDVPLLIGLNWVLLAFAAGSISNYLPQKYFIPKILLGASLMVLLDVLMEPVVAQLDFWEFENNTAPFENYFSWFLIASLMQFLFQKMKIKGDKIFSLNLLGVQIFFFLILNILLK
ncbi:MAG: carotenoid biosynthesis protein [Vicingaceae bacterium]